MKFPTLLISATLLCTASSLVTAGVLQQEPASTAEQDQARLGTPGQQHERLTALCGQWSNEYKLRWGPDQPWMEVEGTSEIQSLLGGRYIMETIEFSMMGMTVEGVNLYGYDNREEEWLHIWLDSSSTWPILSRGTEQEDGSIDFGGMMIDAAGVRPFRMVLKEEAEGERTIDMFDTIPPHGEIQVMTVHSTRD